MVKTLFHKILTHLFSGKARKPVEDEKPELSEEMIAAAIALSTPSHHINDEARPSFLECLKDLRTTIHSIILDGWTTSTYNRFFALPKEQRLPRSSSQFVGEAMCAIDMSVRAIMQIANKERPAQRDLIFLENLGATIQTLKQHIASKDPSSATLIERDKQPLAKQIKRLEEALINRKEAFDLIKDTPVVSAVEPERLAP